MNQFKRWKYLALTAVLSCCLTLPAFAAGDTVPATAIFTEAEQVDNVKRDLAINMYRRDDAGVFQSDTALQFSSPINRATGDAVLTFRIARDGVQITVDYLTDLNKDGVYEMLDGEKVPVSDAYNMDGTLTTTPELGAPHLNAGDYALSAETLKEAGERARQARMTAGSGQQTGVTPAGNEPIIYLINCRDGDTVTSHYFALFDKVLMPKDVPVDSWYYKSVEYAMEKGYLNGSGPDSFTPAGLVTRAQLAQVLWKLGGMGEAEKPNYTDVPENAWFYKAIAWCTENEILLGTEGRNEGLFEPDREVSREEMADVLFVCAKFSGRNIHPSESLDRFKDSGDVSVWAKPAMQWAVATGIISGFDDGTLQPAGNLTRAELSSVLMTFLNLEVK